MCARQKVSQLSLCYMDNHRDQHCKQSSKSDFDYCSVSVIIRECKIRTKTPIRCTEQRVHCTAGTYRDCGYESRVLRHGQGKGCEGNAPQQLGDDRGH